MKHRTHVGDVRKAHILRTQTKAVSELLFRKSGGRPRVHTFSGREGRYCHEEGLEEKTLLVVIPAREGGERGFAHTLAIWIWKV